MNIFKSIRIILGLTQVQAASILGIRRSIYNLVENERRDLPAKALEKFCELSMLMEKAAEARIPVATIQYNHAMLHGIARQIGECEKAFRQSFDKFSTAFKTRNQLACLRSLIKRVKAKPSTSAWASILEEYANRIAKREFHDLQELQFSIERIVNDLAWLLKQQTDLKEKLSNKVQVEGKN